MFAFSYVAFTCGFNRTLIGHMDLIRARLKAVDFIRGGAQLDIGASKLHATWVQFQQPRNSQTQLL